MKKTLSIAICLTIIAGSVSAQRRYHQQRNSQRDNNGDYYSPKIGLTIGGNVSNQISTNNSNYSTGSIVGFNAGLTFDLPIIYPLSFAPEVLFSQKGYEATTPSGIF